MSLDAAISLDDVEEGSDGNKLSVGACAAIPAAEGAVVGLAGGSPRVIQINARTATTISAIAINKRLRA